MIFLFENQFKANFKTGIIKNSRNKNQYIHSLEAMCKMKQEKIRLFRSSMIDKSDVFYS